MAISFLKKLQTWVTALVKPGTTLQPPRQAQTRPPAGPMRERNRRPPNKSRERQATPARVPRAPAEPAPETHRTRRWDPSEFTVAPEAGKVRFQDLDLPPEVMHAIFDLGFQFCTPIQAGILLKTLSGMDATGRAQTGTGKTAAFLITILTHFLRKPAAEPRKRGTPRALILAPTRELVLQIDKDAKALSRHTRFKTMAVFGGMDYMKQKRMLGEGPIDIVAATPGRLLDYKRRGDIDLGRVEILVIDEADRMLDMGFIPDVRRIIESTPMKGKRQTMFFSATLTPEVNRLAASWTRDAAHVDVTPPREMTLAAIDQVVYITTNDEKFSLLYNIIDHYNLERVMVFANRRDETQALKDQLAAHGISCGLLSGDVSQEQRVKTLEAFRAGTFRVLVATDVAARGLHIEGVSHVVNYTLPMDPEDYVHRIGRTGRAGATGTSVSFATETEAYEIPAIEQYIGRELRSITPDKELLASLPTPAAMPAREHRRHGGGGHRSGHRGPRRGGRGRPPSRPGHPH
ncbi:MAG TPA: DEAD/DEAH box helicase [Bacteroidota bacterium]|nr:DEAD/DEAH box helicase [Bacteroidota bacterium]